MKGKLCDVLQVWGFDGDFIIFSDGSLGFGLELTPLDISCWEAVKINETSGKIARFLNGLPSGIDIQFIQEISGGNTEVLTTHANIGINGTDLLSKNLSAVRVERLEQLDQAGHLPRHRLKVFVRGEMNSPLLKNAGLFSKTKLFEPLAEANLAQELIHVSRLRDTIMGGIRTLEIETKPLSSDAVATLLYWQWNPSREIPRNGYDPEDVRHSLLFTDAMVNESGFSLGKMHHRVISLKIHPDETFASMAAHLRELPFDSRLFLSVYVPDQQKEVSSLQTQRRVAFSMAKGKQSGVSDIDSESKFQDVESLLTQMIAQGEKVFQVSLTVVLQSKYEEELENRVAATLMNIRGLGGAEAMVESLAAFDIFSEVSIPNARSRERARRMKTSNLCDLLPIYGPWVGHTRPSLLLRSRMGSLIPFDPFARELPNSNQVISGGSGSGKSFLTNLLLLQMLKEKPKVFIVDIGGSYRKLTENLSGQNVLLGNDHNISINPFDLGPQESAPSSQKIKFLLGLVELMTKEEGDLRLPRYARAEIEAGVQLVYQQSTVPSLSGLRQLLIDNENPEIKRLGRILSPWCGNTPYGKFVDRPTTLKLGSPIVAFDLKGMENQPDLQAIALFIITDFVWREVQRDPEQMKFLVLDECWKLLENDAGAAFIGEVFRTFRKYYASAIAISQNIDDFAKSKVAGAILSNSSIKWILMQKGADQARLKEVLQLNDSELALIGSLGQERGHYSEAFLIADSSRSVVAIEPTPLEYWLATSDPRDLTQIQLLSKDQTGLTPLEILKVLSDKFPCGSAASR